MVLSLGYTLESPGALEPLGAVVPSTVMPGSHTSDFNLIGQASSVGIISSRLVLYQVPGELLRARLRNQSPGGLSISISDVNLPPT